MGVPRNALAGDLLSVLARRPNSVALALSLPLLGGVALLAPARAETKPAASVTAAAITAAVVTASATASTAPTAAPSAGVLTDPDSELQAQSTPPASGGGRQPRPRGSRQP